MKKYLIAIFLIPIVQFAAAQNRVDTVWKSNFEKYVDSPHTLIRLEHIDHGRFLGFNVQVCRATDLMTGKVVSALNFGGSSGDQGLLDTDEVPLLLTAMNRINSEILGTPPTNNTTFLFRSRSGLEAGCYPDVKKYQPVWQLYFKPKFRIEADQMTKADFDKLLQLLNEVKGSF